MPRDIERRAVGRPLNSARARRTLKKWITPLSVLEYCRVRFSYLQISTRRKRQTAESKGVTAPFLDFAQWKRWPHETAPWLVRRSGSVFRHAVALALGDPRRSAFRRALGRLTVWIPSSWISRSFPTSTRTACWLFWLVALSQKPKSHWGIKGLSFRPRSPRLVASTYQVKAIHVLRRVPCKKVSKTLNTSVQLLPFVSSFREWHRFAYLRISNR